MAFLLVLLLLSNLALSDEYLNALQSFEKKIQHQRLMAPALLRHRFQAGQWWEVAALRIEPDVLNVGDGAADLHRPQKILRLFRYEVERYAAEKNEPEIQLAVSQIDHPSYPPMDLRVKKIVLKGAPPLNQREKIYWIKNQTTQKEEAISVSPDGIRSHFTALELFPLDMPFANGALKKAGETGVQLPDELTSFLKSEKIQPDLSRGEWFGSTDFFGRKTEFLWARNKPWPQVLKTAQGISVLLRSGRAP